MEEKIFANGLNANKPNTLNKTKIVSVLNCLQIANIVIFYRNTEKNQSITPIALNCLLILLQDRAKDVKIPVFYDSYICSETLPVLPALIEHSISGAGPLDSYFYKGRNCLENAIIAETKNAKDYGAFPLYCGEISTNLRNIIFNIVEETRYFSEDDFVEAVKKTNFYEKYKKTCKEWGYGAPCSFY